MLAPMIKIIIVLLSLAFKCRLVNETSEIALMQAGKQANHLTSAIGRAGNITKFTENRASKIFFPQDSKEICSLIFVSAIKKVYQENIPFVKPIHIIGLIILPLILPLIHTCSTTSILSYILKDNFQKPNCWIFHFFSYSSWGGLIQISSN